LNQSAAGVERLFKALANHSDLIAEAYFQGIVYQDDKNQRALNQLRQLKVLVKQGEDGYRIAGRLNQFLDHALSSDRVRRLDTDLASWIETLEQQISLYRDAWGENRPEDSDNYLAEVERLVFDLADTLEDNTRYLLMLVNSRFANVRTLAEKQKQNAFYISRLEKLVNAISSLQPELLLEMVEELPILYELLDQQLIRVLPVYQQRLQDILDKLKVFLFELRQIEARAKLVQGFVFFLRQNPGYQTQDWSEADTIPEFWNQIQPLQLQAYADPLDNVIEEELIEIAQRIKIDTEALLAKQKKRSINSVTAVNPEKQRLEIPLYRKQLRALLQHVRGASGKTVSALAFRQAFVSHIEPSIWLACVMNECLRQRYQHLQIEYRLHGQGSHFSGNKKITDILLSHRLPPL
jgi:hypothetical protein